MDVIEKKKRSVEALLFVEDSSVSSRKLAEVVGCTPSDVKKIIRLLNDEYERNKRAFIIKKVNKGYKMMTRPEFAEIIKRLKGKRELFLSDASMTTLAVIAYRQPVTRKEIEWIRGVDCSGVLNTLQEAGFVKVIGKGDGFGHPYLFGTTDKFLEAFNLDSLDELPEIEDEDSAFFGEGGSFIEKKGS